MEKVKVGRLALRVEGIWWNAYYTLGTMEEAIHLGSIRLTAASNPKVKSAFMDIMQDVVSSMIEDATGLTPGWGEPQKAPESERSGNA
jgi:hypothetical protein